MAIVKEIRITADNSDAKQAADELKTSLKGVDKEAGKASKSIDDVAGNGGAIAILDSLTGGLATRLRDAYEASRLFNISLKATRGALIATGIGALVVALGAVVAYWDDIKMFITGSNGELEDQIDLLDDEASILDRNLKALTDTDNILKLQGLSQREINDLKRKELESIIDIRSQELLLAQERLAQIAEQEKAGIGSVENIFRITQRNATTLGLILDKIFSKFGLNTELGENVNQATESAIESLFGTEEDKKAVEDRINSLTEQINAAKNQIAGFDLEAQEAARKAAEEAASRPQVKAIGGVRNDNFDLDTDPELIFEEEKAKRLADADTELTDILIANAQRELEEKERVATLKQNLEENGLSLLRNIAQEGSKLSKAVAIADVVREQVRSISGIISNTGIANAKAVAASPLTGGQPFVSFNTIAAGLGIGASIAGAAAAIKDITSDKKTLGGGGVGSLGGRGGGVSAPSFNLVEGTGSNQIASGLASDRNPVRAYVVSGDVTSGQELDRNIQGDASLG